MNQNRRMTHGKMWFHMREKLNDAQGLDEQFGQIARLPPRMDRKSAERYYTAKINDYQRGLRCTG